MRSFALLLPALMIACSASDPSSSGAGGSTSGLDGSAAGSSGVGSGGSTSGSGGAAGGSGGSSTGTGGTSAGSGGSTSGSGGAAGGSGGSSGGAAGGSGGSTSGSGGAAGGSGGSTNTGGAAGSGGSAGLATLPAEQQLDLVYRTVSGIDLAGDLSLPERSTPVAAVVQIHGGGFYAGDKAGKAELTWSGHLVAHGFAAFSVNYRLVKDFTGGAVPYPGALHDVKCAIMYLRKNAVLYRIDAGHVFVLGGSAGGWFTNMIGTTGDEAGLDPDQCPLGEGESNRVQGAVTYFGPSDFTALFNDPIRVGQPNGEMRFIGVKSPCTDPAEVAGICTTASPTNHADPSDPPFYITHSDDDPVVPVSQGRLMKSTLDAKGVTATYREVTGEQHGWHAKFTDPVVASVRDEVVAFLEGLR